jgi:uncharacterized coiled-coil protein SlyX
MAALAAATVETRCITLDHMLTADIEAIQELELAVAEHQLEVVAVKVELLEHITV